MRPVFLKICGINSYESEQAIDFERLTAAGLFGIFGSTGSGKSTIIDACTMALFSEMARQNSRECINSCLKEMYVSLEFELRGKRYVAERLYSRDKDSVKQKRARLYEKTGTVICDKPSEMNSAVASLIGLNYKDFSRSVILPQNKFSEFLMLGNRERSDMLERIFGLEEYGDRLIKRINEVKKDYEAELSIVINGMSYYGDISKKRLDEEEAALISGQRVLEELREAREKVRAALEQGQKLLMRVVELEGLSRRLDVLNEKSVLMEKKRGQLKDAGISRIIMPFIKSAEDNSERVIKLKNVLERQDLECSIAEGTLSLSQTAFEEATARKDRALPELAGLEANINQAVEIAADCMRLNKERDELLTAYKAAQTEKSKLEAKRDVVTAGKENARLELFRIAERKVEVTVAPEKRRKIIEIYGLAQEAEKLAVRLKNLDNRTAILLRETSSQTREAEGMADKLEKLMKDKGELSETLEKLNRNRPYIHELQKALSPGEPCPVCGSAEHKIINITVPEGGSITAAEWEHEKAETEKHVSIIDSKVESIKTCIAGLQGRIENSGGLRKELDAERESIENEKKRLETLIEVVCGEKSAVLIFNEMTANDEEAARLQATESALRSRDDAMVVEIERINKGITALDGEISAIKAAGSEKKEQINKMSERVAALIGDRNPEEYLREVKKKMHDLQKITEETKAAFMAAGDRVKLLRAEYDSSRARKEALLKTLEDENAKITELLVMYGMPSREKVKEGWVDDPEGLEREITAYDNQINDLKANIGRIKADIPEAGISAAKLTEEVKALKDNYTNVSAEAERKAESVAVGKERLAAMRENLKKLEDLKQQKKKIDHGLDMLSDLSGLFRGNEFVKYISKRHLLNITIEASRRLREMSKGRYALELDGTEFVVRDDYNGGSRRSPHTLSGGEVFMVSLCLALALSAGIQLKNSAPLEFFFLDEGFGSLDGNTLDTVMNCLEKLRSEKMSIGIISHVEELKNRVPVKLNVSYSAAAGSRVEHEE